MQFEKKRITIFTPTYNRRSTLIRLYESLLAQTCKDFSWVIVDDGSTDDTEEVVHSWTSDNKLDIVYFKQSNQGKPMAHNKGVELADSELFVCVDSDDYLCPKAIQEILSVWGEARINDIGIIAFRGTSNSPITRIKHIPKGNRTSLKNAYDNLGMVGDTMLIYRTSIICKYRFPKIQGEKFVPEAYLYDKLDSEGNMILFPNVVYISEYLNDGYTRNMYRLLANNPRGYIEFINNRLKIDSSFSCKFFDSIRYVAMAKVINLSIIKHAVYPYISVLAYPFGIIMYYLRYKKYIR